MRVFENLTRGFDVGQEAGNLSIGEKQSLSDLKGSVILLVFWKTL